MRKQFIKRAAAVLLSAVCCASMLTGCSKLKNTEIVFSTGLAQDEIFKVGKKVCTKQEVMIYVQSYEKQYEDIYGIAMWDHDFGGVSLEEYVKESIISELATIKAMLLLADEYDVKLTDSEKNSCKAAAEDYLKTLTKQEVSWMDLKKSDAASAFEDHLLAQKVYDEITKDVNVEISDDEARIITVQQIVVDSRDTAEEVLTKARAEDAPEFTYLATEYSKADEVTLSFGRGAKDADFERVAFDLDQDEISDAFSVSNGYCILKCVKVLDKDATEENKQSIREKRKSVVFEEVYEELLANTLSEFNTKAWEKIHFDNPDPNNSPDAFFDIYEAFFAD